MYLYRGLAIIPSIYDYNNSQMKLAQVTWRHTGKDGSDYSERPRAKQN